MTTTLTGFSRPTLEELIELARAEFAARLPDAEMLLGQGVVPRLPELTAAGTHLLHAHLDWSARQSHPLFAEGDWLDSWGGVWGVERVPATKATGTITATGVNDAEIPTGAELVRADGAVYRVTAGGSVADGTVSLPVEAVIAGVAGNHASPAGAQKLSFSSPIAGVDASVTVTAPGLAGGADIEADGRPGIAEAFRSRILARIQQPPHGGAAHDYVAWAKAVAGVTRVWPVSGTGDAIGTVTIYFMMDDLRAEESGIPQGDPAPDYSGDLALVAAAIEAVRPVTAEPIVTAPTPVEVDLTVSALSPDTPEIRAAISTELAAMLRRRAEPGLDISRSWIAEAVAIAAGEDSHILTAPAGNVSIDAGEIAIPGTITYA
jgi:uncharacterized phage protein gp47/JayE